MPNVKGMPKQPTIEVGGCTPHILKQACQVSGEITVGHLKVSSGKKAKK